MKIELAKTELIHFIGIGEWMSGLTIIMQGLDFKIQGSVFLKIKILKD